MALPFCSNHFLSIYLSFTENTFPFQVDKLTDEESENPYFCIQASVGDIEGYPDLFDEYGFGGNGY
ncbi:hypothetical protein [Hymenobacter lapidarius]|uniref:hypothetical protein n=1 Tax=Hymenobacter lapidarius TaxID=1908237 RepID=UPI000F7664D9|nr:hypothetical protein [Hymenobacter lapidarius]